MQGVRVRLKNISRGTARCLKAPDLGVAERTLFDSVARSGEEQKMGVFFTSSQSPVPTIKTAIRDALLVNPAAVPNADSEAANRTIAVIGAATRIFNFWRFIGALLISAALLSVAIWTAKNDLPDISKVLVNSFVGFSGIALGLLGGEAQKSI